MPIAPSWQFALSTPVTRLALGGGRVSRSAGKRRKKKQAAPKRKAMKSKKRKASKPAKLKKGSAAAKAYMAKIRKKRGKKR